MNTEVYVVAVLTQRFKVVAVLTWRFRHLPDVDFGEEIVCHYEP